MTDILKNLTNVIDASDAAYVTTTATTTDDIPQLFVLVSKDPDTIRDIQELMENYDRNN